MRKPIAATILFAIALVGAGESSQDRVYRWLASQHVSAYDKAESVAEREERLRTIAVALAPYPRQMRAMLLIQARAESGFRRDVQLCRCPPKQCDEGRAYGLWQSHRRPVDTWLLGSAPWCGVELEHVQMASERVAVPAPTVEEWFRRQGGNRAKIDDAWVVERARQARELARKL